MQNISFKKVDFPYSFVEEIKQLRTNIEYSGADNKVIMITSSAEGEGKSTLTFELCRSFAELGKRVLLVDADLRKSTLHSKVTTNPKPRGLSYFLSGQSELENVLCGTDIPRMYCVISGRVPPNPAELLASSRMHSFIEWAKSQFDYVFIDCPPINIVVDASIVASYADASVLVVKAGDVSRKIIQDAAKQLKKIECPVIGVVLNQVDDKARVAYKKYGYGYNQDPNYGVSKEQRNNNSNKQ